MPRACGPRAIWAHAGHLKLAGWRETGALLGVCAAAAAPTFWRGTGVALRRVSRSGSPLCLVALRPDARPMGTVRRIHAPTGFREILSDSVTRRLLLIALMNAAPVAVSSTVFLFFVGSVLDAEGWEGGLLILYFLAAAGRSRSGPASRALSGSVRSLLVAMALAIATFSRGADARGRGCRHSSR
jgi:GPH family glycoside/pentoside/hexuronide:cation symporter